MTLYDDIQPVIGDGFDAVICLGNSFAHMHDNFGDQREQKTAIGNFEKCLRPGGLLLIDHRNYDHMIATGSTPSKCIYYNVSEWQYYDPNQFVGQWLNTSMAASEVLLLLLLSMAEVIIAPIVHLCLPVCKPTPTPHS